jgi:hypothetical protein
VGLSPPATYAVSLIEAPSSTAVADGTVRMVGTARFT